MNDAAFAHAQALYDAAEPDWTDDEIAPPEPVGLILEDLLSTDRSYDDVGAGEVHILSDRQATVAIWIDGHEYSLTLNRED